MTRQYGAIRNYIRRLPLALAEKYGDQMTYTENQVAGLVIELQLNRQYILYALLMYSDREVIHSKGIAEHEITLMLKTIKTAKGVSLA